MISEDSKVYEWFDSVSFGLVFCSFLKVLREDIQKFPEQFATQHLVSLVLNNSSRFFLLSHGKHKAERTYLLVHFAFVSFRLSASSEKKKDHSRFSFHEKNDFHKNETTDERWRDFKAPSHNVTVGTLSS